MTESRNWRIMTSKIMTILGTLTIVVLGLSFLLPFWELDWNAYAIINDVTNRPRNGIEYRVVEVDGKPANRMRGRFQSRAPLVLTDKGTHEFAIEKSEKGIAKRMLITATVEIGHRYRVSEESGSLDLILEKSR